MVAERGCIKLYAEVMDMGAVARFDMPEECYQCPCCGIHMQCQLFHSRNVSDYEGRPEWCPLEEED